jgi:hypothetical protein
MAFKLAAYQEYWRAERHVQQFDVAVTCAYELGSSGQLRAQHAISIDERRTDFKRG